MSKSLEEKLDLLEQVIKLNTERIKNLENIEYQLSDKKTTLGEIAKITKIKLDSLKTG
jgi:hypothetical protein